MGLKLLYVIYKKEICYLQRKFIILSFYLMDL